MLSNGLPIPVHFPVEAVTATIYTVTGELGYILGAPAIAATWTLPALADSAFVAGAPLWIRNSGPGTITLVPAVGESINGSTLVTPGYIASLFTDTSTTWKVASVSAVNGGPPPTTLTVNPALVADGVTTFSTIQSAIDSLSNKSVQGTIINVSPGVYPENVGYFARLSSSSENPNTFISLSLLGDLRNIAGCGIAHDCPWNRQGTPGVVGGGNNSLAVLAGTSGGTTLSVTAFSYSVGTASQAGTTITGIGTTFTPYMVGGTFTFGVPATVVTITAYISPTSLTVSAAQVVGATTYTINQGTSPDFVAAGVIAGDRIAVRHNQGVVPQFALYTISTVASTVLTLTSALLGDVNAVGSAMCVVPNVEVSPASGPAFDVCGTLGYQGFFLRPTASSSVRMQFDTAVDMENCLCYGGEAFITAFRSAIRTDLNPYGNTFFGASGRGLFTYGLSMSQLNSSLICPGTNAYAITADQGARVATGSINAIGNGTNGLCIANAGQLAFGGVSNLICTTGTAVSATPQAIVTTTGANTLRIRGYAGGGPSVGIVASRQSLVSATSNTSGPSVVFDCANSAASFIGVLVGNDAATPSAAGGEVILNSWVLATPASSLLARIASGTLTVTRIQSTTPGLNSNGFQVLAGSILRWIASGAGVSDLAGGGGTGTLFDMREGSLLSFTTGVNRNFSGYGTIFSFDNNSQGYISDVTCTTSNAGANTNLLVNNGSKVVLGNATFVVSGANIGISEINGGSVIRQVGTTLTNGAATPVLGPSVGTPTGDLITPVITAGSTNLAGSFTASTTAGASAGGVTLTFSSAFAVAPKALTFMAFGAALPTSLRLVSLSTTAAVLALVTPAGAGTAFGVIYQVST